jgi:NADPH:quinone reductase-like Zn-dependent oxidoreductase
MLIHGTMLTELKTPERLEPMKRYVYDHLADGSLRPRVDRVFPFEEATEAYQYLESIIRSQGSDCTITSSGHHIICIAGYFQDSG